MGPTEKLARFVVEYPAGEIPDSIYHLGKRCLINFLGVSLNASQDPSVDILLNLFREEGGAARASVIGKTFRTNLQNAAMANGYLGHFLDYDDTHYLNMIHASSPIFPACLAAGEANGAGGKESSQPTRWASRRHAALALSSHRTTVKPPLTGTSRASAACSARRRQRDGCSG